jgi:hypothetical protein
MMSVAGLDATPDVLLMQKRLFDCAVTRLYSVSYAAMWRRLRALRETPELAGFRLWLVGSRLEPEGQEESDVDLVLSPGSAGAPGDAAIDAALWFCRQHGFWGGDPPCVIDPCFRQAGPRQVLKAMEPDVPLLSVKLLSPRLLGLAQAGGLSAWRRVGRYSLEYQRPAGAASYYAKLPKGTFAAGQRPFLRPAMEVIPARGRS